MKKTEVVVYDEMEIRFKDDELMNLTQMWRAVDGKDYQKPVMWLRKTSSVNFIKTLEKQLKGVKKAPLKMTSKRYLESYLLKTVKGRYGGTYAHWQIALQYARYLDPEFAIWCNEVFSKIGLNFCQIPRMGYPRTLTIWRVNFALI